MYILKKCGSFIGIYGLKNSFIIPSTSSEHLLYARHCPRSREQSNQESKPGNPVGETDPKQLKHTTEITVRSRRVVETLEKVAWMSTVRWGVR